MSVAHFAETIPAKAGSPRDAGARTVPLRQAQVDSWSGLFLLVAASGTALWGLLDIASRVVPGGWPL